MIFTWVDYCEKYENEIDAWMNDELIIRHAVDESLKADHLYYTTSSEFILNENYFCKVILEGEAVIGVMTLLINENNTDLNKNLILINSIFTSPEKRNQGYGKKIINELIVHTEKIIPYTDNIFEAEIDTDNAASIHTFDKLGFVFVGKHDKNDYGYEFGYWVYPVSELECYRKHLKSFLADKIEFV